jgi:hypothetical protein
VRNGRWWLAGTLTLVTFLVITWGVTKYLPVTWLKDPAQRLTVGSGAGLAVAGVAALWGKSFATARAPDTEPEATAANSGSHAENTVIIKEDNAGIASAGDHVTNVQRRLADSDTHVKASHRSGPIRTAAVRKNQVRIERNSTGIASAGDDATNIQETR